MYSNKILIGSQKIWLFLSIFIIREVEKDFANETYWTVIRNIINYTIKRTFTTKINAVVFRKAHIPSEGSLQPFFSAPQQ